MALLLKFSISVGEKLCSAELFFHSQSDFIIYSELLKFLKASFLILSVSVRILFQKFYFFSVIFIKICYIHKGFIIFKILLLHNLNLLILYQKQQLQLLFTENPVGSYLSYQSGKLKIVSNYMSTICGINIWSYKSQFFSKK